MAATRAFLSVLLPLCARQGVSAGEYEYYLGGKQNPQSNGQQAPALNNGQNIYGISFDCMADFDICAIRWSERKKAWCQEHRHLLCSFERQAPPQSVRMAPPTPPPTLPPTTTITSTRTSTTRTVTSTKTTTTRTTTTRTTTTRTTTTGSSTTLTRAPTTTVTSTTSTRTTTTITGTSTKTTVTFTQTSVTMTQTSVTTTQTSVTVTTTTTTLKPTTTTLKVVAAPGSSSVVAGGAGPVPGAQGGGGGSAIGGASGEQGAGAAGHVGGVSVGQAGGGGTDVLGSGMSPVAAAAAASHAAAAAASQRSPMPPTVPPRPPTYPPRGPAPTPGPTPEPFQVTFTLSPEREHPSPSVTFSPYSEAPTPMPYPPPSWPPAPVPATAPPPAPHTMPPPETTTFTLPPTQPPYVPPAAPSAVVTTVATTTTQLVTFQMTAVPTTSTEQVISDASTSTHAASTSKPTTTSTTNTVTGEAVQVSLEVSGKNATALVQQEDFIASFRDAVRTGIAAVAGSFFDRVMPEDVAVEEHVASEHSLYVFGTVRPQSHGSSKSIRHRLGKNNQRLAQVVVAQMRKLKGLEGLSVTNVEVVGRKEEAPTWSNIILGAVHSMGFKMDRMPKSVFHPHHSSAGRAFRSEGAQVESGSTRKAGHELAESETSFHEGKRKNASSHKANSVAFSMTIHNIDYVKLTKHEGLCYKFKKVVMHTVASAGGSIKRDHVHVDLKPGSVRVRCTIVDLPSSTLKAAEENLRSTKDALAGLIAMRVKALANVDEVMTGEIAVKDLLVFRKLTAVYSGAEDMVPEEEEGEAEEEEFEEEEEAEGHHWSQYDVGMAELLLGLVAGIILLFYLVNWKDTDIRRNSWTIVSNTIAIFISVLIFDCLSDVVDRLLVGTFLVVHLIVSYLIVLGLFVVMQAVTAILSGTMFDTLANDMEEENWVISDVSNPRYGKRIQPEQLLYKLDTLRSMNATKAVALVDGAEVFVSRETLDKEERIINMSSYVTLLTYMTAFAAINAGSTLMNFQFFAASPYAAALPVLLAQVLLGCLFLLFRYARGAHNAGGPEQIWEAECIRAESDIACLSGSFLFVQVTRFLISGKLPDKFGLEHPEEPHSLNCVLLLYLVGFLAAIFSLTVPSCRLPERLGMGAIGRTIQNGTSMVFAWSMIWATRWLALRVPWFRTMGVGPGTLPWQIILTGAAFAIAFIFIVVLRQVERVASDAGEVTRGVISALSLLVGFTFQRLFEEALQKAVRFAPRPFLVEMGASLLIAAFVVPAWRKYILVKVWSFRVGQDGQRYIEAAREPKDPAPLHQQTSFTRLTSWGRKTSESGT